MNDVAIGQNIQTARESAHLTLGELATRLGCRPSRVARVEGGRGLSKAFLEQFATVLETTTETLLG